MGGLGFTFRLPERLEELEPEAELRNTAAAAGPA